MATPLISIIVPVYNRADWVTACVDSCRAQTIKNIEIILVDDGSTDRTPEVCRELCRKDFRIKWLQSVNQGVCAARNMGLALAAGEFVYFLDSDDVLMPFALEYSLACINWHKVGIVVCGEGAFSQNGIKTDAVAASLDEARAYAETVYESCPEKAVVYPNFIACSSEHSSSFNAVMLRKAICMRAGGFEPCLRAGEEAVFKMKIGILCPDEKVAWNLRPMTLLKRISDVSLAMQMRHLHANPWGLRSLSLICELLIEHQLVQEHRHRFDALHSEIIGAFSRNQYADAYHALEIWKQSLLPLPASVSNFRRFLHSVLGVASSEILLNYMRKFKGWKCNGS